MSEPQIFVGRVMHQRHSPTRHGFSYPSYFLSFDVSQQNLLKNALFSLNKFNVFSFYERDHGPRDGSNLVVWARSVLAAQGMSSVDGSIVLYVMPRVLGYVFNPVSFWFCHDSQARLRAILCEVNNTFGERHIYLLATPDEQPIIQSQTLNCRKVFHVSPFMENQGSYRFTFSWDDRVKFSINHYDADEQLLLSTCLTGTAQSYTVRNLAKLAFQFTWHTLAVMARIHIQAFFLWRKKIHFIRKPLPPHEEISR